MSDGIDENPGFGGNQSDSRDGMIGVFEADEFWVRVCVVPQEQGAVYYSPRVVDFREQAQLRVDFARVESI
jgi:hypothetical protein